MPEVFSEDQLAAVLLRSDIDAERTEKILRIIKNENKKGVQRKDNVIVPVRPALDHRIYENGPFSVFASEITSLAISGGSPMMEWMPTRTMKSRKAVVSHLEWMAPEGFTGKETYPEFLAAIELGECGYGPATAWNGFSYEMGSGSFSFKTNSMKPYEDGGIRFYEEQPSYTIRGGPGEVGGLIDNDGEWAVARLLMQAEQHVDFLMDHGDRSNSPMEWDGIDLINRPGFVASRIIGSGHATWADPIWVNGAGISDLGKILQTIRVIIRLLRTRAFDRRWSLNPGDMVIYMDRAMWTNLIAAVASGGLNQLNVVFGFEGRIDIDVFERRVNDLFQNGAIMVDGQSIPIITNSALGAGVDLTVDDGQGGTVTVPAIAGDIHILTRQVNGTTIWYQEYLDWNNWEYPAAKWEESRFALQGGVVRAGWVEEASKCYYYFMEMVGRVVCSMLPMQGRISSVVVPLLDQMELEQGAFWARQFYAYGGAGAAGHQGADLLVPTP